MILFFASICLTISILIITNSANAHNHTAHNHDAHVHGLAQITMAVDDNTVFINLVAPAHSLIGFEHQANTPDEIAIIQSLKTTLANNMKVLTIPNARCRLIESKVETGDLLVVDEPKSHLDDSHTKHYEITASYNLSCEQLANVSSASVPLFKYFPAIETVDVMWITTQHQGAASLTAKNNIVYWQ